VISISSLPLPRVLPALGDPALFSATWPVDPYLGAGSAIAVSSVLNWEDIVSMLSGQAIQTPSFRMVMDNELLP
jgi:hypothetical protein